MRDRDFICDKPADLTRFWCHYNDLEEYHHGMWRRICGEDSQLKTIAASVRVLRNPDRFQIALIRVISEWPTSCLAEFTGPGNHIAWMGQAACCIDSKIPEEMTRRAWWKLSVDERETANRLAREAIRTWRRTNNVTVNASGVTTKPSKNSTRACGTRFLTLPNGNASSVQLSLF